MCGGVCCFAAAVADAGVCARAWAAMRARVVRLDGLQLVSGHDFSRAESASNSDPALAAAGMQIIRRRLTQKLKPSLHLRLLRHD